VSFACYSAGFNHHSHLLFATALLPAATIIYGGCFLILRLSMEYSLQASSPDSVRYT
jgi:hypothetical protein